jgi:hypothetical protein
LCRDFRPLIAELKVIPGKVLEYKIYFNKQLAPEQAISESDIIIELVDTSSNKSGRRNLLTRTNFGFSYSLIENVKLQDYSLKFSEFTSSVYNKELIVKFKGLDDIVDKYGNVLTIEKLKV